jgi:ABC-type multidrug transport system fused ATPase/permease subunit
MRRYPRVWWRLLRLCFAREPRLATTALALRLLSLVTVPASGLALRAAVNASAGGVVRAALIGAVGAAFAYSANTVAEYTGLGVRHNVVERVSALVLDPEIVRDVYEIDTMDHLERTDFLDRLTVLRGQSWNLLASAWNALDGIVNGIRIAIILALLGTVSPLLLLLLAFAAIPLWFDGRGRRVVGRAELATAEDVRLQRKLFELVTGAASGKEIRVAAAGPWLIRRQAAAHRAVQDVRFRAQVANAAWQAGGWTVFTLGFAAALALVVRQAAHGTGSVGDVVLSITVATTLRGLVAQAVLRSTLAAGATRLIEPYLWLREYAAAERARGAGASAAPSVLRDGIRLRNLSYRYPGTDSDAVHDVSAHLPAGSVVAVVGEYGSGKSTLVKLLCQFHRPTSGTIEVDAVALADIDTRSWWARMAVAFQDFGRYHVEFGETVGLGDLPHLEDDERIREAVVAADAASLLDRLPNGLATPLGTQFGGVDLSEGQWQKTALARASMRPGPLLFVLDEPTASLDAPSERAIFERYMHRAKELAVRAGAVTVIVSHRFSTVAGADLILVMDGGRLIEVGSHDDLLARGGAYAELHGISSHAYSLD